MLVLARTLTLLVFCALLLAGCGLQTGPVALVKVGMLVRGLGDKGFSDSADAGLQAAHRRAGVPITVLKERRPAHYASDLVSLVKGGATLTFAIGYNMAADVSEVATQYPQAHFAIIDADVDEPNVTSVTFRSEEGAFLAGALAALASRTKMIGFIGGMDEPVIRTFEAGYIAGARQADPAVRVDVKIVGSFEDTAAAQALARQLYAARTDIIFTAAGGAGLGVIDEARRRRGAYVIGVDMDEDAIAPGIVLTTVLKRVDVSVERLCEMASAHREAPHLMSFGLREGGVGLTDSRYARAIVTPRIRTQIARLQKALIAGIIDAPHDLDGAAAYRRVNLP